MFSRRIHTLKLSYFSLIPSHFLSLFRTYICHFYSFSFSHAVFLSCSISLIFFFSLFSFLVVSRIQCNRKFYIFIIIVIPRYESAAPLIIFVSFCLLHSFRVFFAFLRRIEHFTSKCNRDHFFIFFFFYFHSRFYFISRFFFYKKCTHLLRLNCLLSICFRIYSVLHFLRYNNILYVYGSTDVRLHCNSNVCHEGLLVRPSRRRDFDFQRTSFAFLL